MFIFKAALLLLGVFSYVQAKYFEVEVAKNARHLIKKRVDSLVYTIYMSNDHNVDVISWTIYRNYAILNEDVALHQFGRYFYLVSGSISLMMTAESEYNLLDALLTTSNKLKGMEKDGEGNLVGPGLIHKKAYGVVLINIGSKMLPTANYAYSKVSEATLTDVFDDNQGIQAVFFNKGKDCVMLKAVSLKNFNHKGGSKFTADTVTQGDSTEVVAVPESADVVMMKERDIFAIGKVTKVTHGANKVEFTVFGKEFFESIPSE